jgi:hypothetical protein
VSLDELRAGCVIRFPCLWVREAERGETEGRKPRPVVVGVRIARQRSEDVLVLFPSPANRPPLTASPQKFLKWRNAALGSTPRCASGSYWTNTTRTRSASHSISSRSRRSAASATFFLPLMKEFIAHRASTRGVSPSSDDRVDRFDHFAQTQRYLFLREGPDLILESVHRLLCGNGIEILPIQLGFDPIGG